MKGNLHPSINRTVPQEYFSSKQDAQLAYMNNVREKSGVPSQPMGVREGTLDGRVPCNDNETITLDLEQEEIAKADTLARAILNATSGTVPTGMHDIHIHVNLPPQYANEVYNERLAAVPPQKTRQKAKAIHGRIEGYDVTCLFYPISPKAIITIPCSDKPYPISPYPDDSVLTSEFNDFVAHIRYFLCSRLSDYRGVIVPPIHSSRWRFIQADINWDTEITVQEYRIMFNIQLKTWNGVRLQLYKKRIKGGLYYARAEERFHQFSTDNKTTLFDANIGSTIKDAVKSAQKELSNLR
jgi:hypothetical protein